MDLDEIIELITLLESEVPTTLGEGLSMRDTALSIACWLRREYGDQTPVWLEKRARAIFDRANESIGRWTAKPRLCLNA